VKPVRVVEGRAAPLGRSDVDTDQIIPSEWLKRVERAGFGRGLFSEWRDEPSFVLNRPEYQGARVLVAGARFGTGSSREHAVWALLDYGFEAVVASSFGDIFRSNAAKGGLVTVELDPEALASLAAIVEGHPGAVVTIDVDGRTVEVAESGFTASFALDDDTRARLLNGWDDISLTLRHDVEIDRFEATHTGGLESPAAALRDGDAALGSSG
jgi:3-isopropylmalate/(R)-2-methylmalate dehydratase small subunit